MIRIICVIFIDAIEDLEICLGNSNLPLRKSAIWFEPLAQKVWCTILLILKVYFTRAYIYLEKTWAKTPFLCQNQIVIIFWKQVLKQIVKGAEEKFEIIVISNKYKNSLDNLIDSSDIEFLDWPNFSDWLGLINKGPRNIPRSRSNSPTLSNKDCLDENVPVTLLEPVI